MPWFPTDLLVKVLYRFADKVIAVFEGIRTKLFEEGVPVILSVGRLVPQKGFDILLKAFKKVVNEIDARLLILGEGTEKESLSELAEDLKK